MKNILFKIAAIVLGLSLGLALLFGTSIALKMAQELKSDHLNEKFIASILPEPYPLKDGRAMNPEAFHSIRGPNLDEYWEFKRIIIPDPITGIRLRENAVARHQLWKGEKKIFAATYRTDNYGRRKVVKNPTAKHFVAFFGCSFTFGNSIEDEETLPAQFAKLDKTAAAYNYGAPGTGPNYLLSMLRNRDLRNEIPEKNGIGIYTFL